MQQYRIANGFSLEELSQRIHLPQADLVRIELGQKEPSNFLIINLCQLYGIEDFSTPPPIEASLFDSDEPITDPSE